jgi:hypothetical protein
MTVFFGALAGVLVLALVAGVTSIVMGRPVQAQSADVTGMRQVTVVGRGEVSGTPDTAQVRIGVETNAPTTQEALEQNNQQVQAIIDRMQQFGIEESDIQTSEFNMYARYDNNGQEVVGYNVSNTVTVTIRNLDQAGTLLDEVVQVGANRIYGINFRVDEPDVLISQARDEAIAQAREKAEQLAQQSGASVGRVLVITENIGEPPPMPRGYGSAMPAQDQAAADVPVQGGEQTFNASVQITFELE